MNTEKAVHTRGEGKALGRSPPPDAVILASRPGSQKLCLVQAAGSTGCGYGRARSGTARKGLLKVPKP